MQNVKRILIITIAVAFGVAVIASCIFLFSVKKVSADYSVYGDSSAEEIQRELESFRGKSLVFLNTADVYAVTDAYPYYTVVSVEKQYPNVLKVSVKKRVEAFKIVSGDKTYVIDGEGVILNDTGATQIHGKVLTLNLGGEDLISADLGKKISTTYDDLFYALINSAKSLNLCDVVEKVEIDGKDKRKNAVFYTYTGVKAVVWDIDNAGEQKIIAAFEKYSALGDYEKTACWIDTNAIQETDYLRIVATWTRVDPLGE